MGALKHFFNNPHVNKHSKYLIFKAIPINLLLWGCETWAIKQTHQEKLEAFLQRHLWAIPKITMSQVMEERITRDKMRQKFYNIPSVTNMITIHQLSFIGKVVRSDTPNLPTKFMITGCYTFSVLHKNTPLMIRWQTPLNLALFLLLIDLLSYLLRNVALLAVIPENAAAAEPVYAMK